MQRHHHGESGSPVVKAGASETSSFQLQPTHLAMVDADGHTSMHNGDFDVVFSRGHGEELAAPVSVVLTQEGMESRRVKTFRKWW